MALSNRSRQFLATSLGDRVAASELADEIDAGILGTSGQDISANTVTTNAAGRGSLPIGAPALVAAPSITVATANPGSTPYYISATSGGDPDTGRFTFSGGIYEQMGNVYPWTNAAGWQIAQYPIGYGRATVDFISDAPTITFTHGRQYSSATRLLVDGVEVWRAVNALRAGTAQGGSSSAITLDAGAAAANGYYVGEWVRISGGTGAGQQAQISAYNGTTKTASIQPNWTTAPDSTSTFEITNTRADYSNSTNTGASSYYLTLSWNERRIRHYRLEQSQAFFGIYTTGVVDTVAPTSKPTGSRCIWVGDSYSTGTGTDWGSGLASVASDSLGLELVNLSIGGTGYLNPGSSFNFVQRLTPPINAWTIKWDGASAGSLALTQNNRTITIGYNDSQAVIQAAFDATFGAGQFLVFKDVAAIRIRMWVLGLGKNADFLGAMTADFSGLTGATTASISRYLGDLDPVVPRDASGNHLPFTLVLAGGHNDTTGSNAAYTPAALQSTVTSLLSNLRSRYPTARIFVVGIMSVPGGSVSGFLSYDPALLAATTASIPKINGVVPFIETVSPGWFTGTGYLGNLRADGNSDIACSVDGVHPTTIGHDIYGRRIAREIQKLLGVP